VGDSDGSGLICDDYRQGSNHLVNILTLCCGTDAASSPFGSMKDRRFNAVRVVASTTGRMLVVTSVLRAVEQLLNYWPVEQGEKLSVARRALLLCLERKLSPADARGAFIEAAKEAGNYVDEPMRLAPAGNVKKWHKSKRGRFGINRP
jgi:hypothetical protein